MCARGVRSIVQTNQRGQRPAEGVPGGHVHFHQGKRDTGELAQPWLVLHAVPTVVAQRNICVPPRRGSGLRPPSGTARKRCRAFFLG